MKTHFTKLLYIILFVFTAGAVNAQNAKTTTAIHGILQNDQAKPMDYATVTLLRAKDSSVVKGTLTNDAGKYQFEGITAGRYMVKATTVGYQPAFTAAFEVDATTTAFTAPVIKILQNSQSLQGVTIIAAKPLIERKLDRTVMNVENSVLAAGNNALEILERAPGVTVDKDDNISVKGKQGVTVMINDKLTYMSAAQLATYLRSTDGSNIQSIEIITNPSAKYDASGNSGIINIKLKKNKLSGTNGSLTVNAAYGKNFRDNTSLTLNHKTGNLNLFGTLSRGDINRENLIDIDRYIDSASKTTYFKQKTTMLNHIHYNNYRFGADYSTSDKNTIGFVVNGDYTNEYNDNKSTTYLGLTPAANDSYQNTLTDMKQTYRSISANINDRLQLDTNGQALSFDLDYSRYHNNSDAKYDTYFFKPDGSSMSAPLFLTNQTPSFITIWTQKADYTKQLTKTLKFEAGAKFSSVKTDNDLQAQINNNGTFVNDTTRTNRFVYDEKIAAGYLNLGKTFAKTSVQAGLRAERTSSTGNLVTGNQVVKRQYLDFFPSVFINHTLSDKHEIGISYSRRIDRPNYDNLNPFRYYLDQYTYEQGNPFLKPQYTNSFELSYTYNKTINVTLGYSRTSDVSTQVLLTDSVTKATYQTNLNLQSQDSYNININSPYTIAKWWTGNINATGFYQKFKADSLLGGQLNAGKAAYQIRATQNFLFSGFKAEVSGNYQSSLRYGIFDIRPQYSVDAGVSRSFANKKLNVKLSVSDIFDTRRNNVSSHFQSVNLDIRQKNETRLGRLTLTYNFGNSKIKASQRQTGADDEKGRVKSGG
ncbi:TonB-dependent receptor domain-containing protein [Mucilaginibacter phyllosphaerae]|uniref:Outer membrane receptor protein involved in Fe transport n=1 Tax=Mucilaginibacter phyllosphaerae TaxID=1812349 RepID=A0A4Y8AE37_9SPHI|nr:TonB-dependent receptor [Mucilaginibacter phyllosphaerae]MBB3970070.1 outer membrane receptor protein involved in Fe transport [Mucilaginibacter phyllosphaerae]TEW66462.1 TonB-dependent receptor [Mucilaginibacter phyllosphaerae]GGH09585.1 TonB-dependent receptor [Mucilaginibacter phyllosphaerae]